MRTMYDAVTAANITKKDPNPAMVAGYIDKIKLEPWSAADWARFPNARKVTIVKKASTNDGHVLDVEPGDATPEEAPGWVAMRRRSGLATPTIYCNRSTWPKVRAAFDRANVPYPLFWIATASGRPEIPAGAIAAQYLLDVAPGIDVSAVADYWPGVDPTSTKEADLDDNQDQLLREAHLFLTGSGGPVYPGNNTVSIPTQIGNLAKSLTALTTLVTQQAGLKASDIAAAILPALQDTVREGLVDVDGLDEQAVADRLAVNLTNRLAS